MRMIGLIVKSIVILCCTLYALYSIKVALNINLNIAGKEHFPQLLEDVSHGIIRCTWFPNSHHCKCNRK